MKCLVIGKGGREHAIAHTLHTQGHQVYCIPGNGGTAKFCLPLSEKWERLNGNDFKSLALFAKEEEMDFTIVGPERPLEQGIVDLFCAQGLAIFGPTKRAAQLESSKVFSKEFLSRYRIPTADFVLCRNLREARRAVEARFDSWGGVVVKPDGLTAGKGVTVCSTKEEAEIAIQEMFGKNLYGIAGNQALIERPLKGQELSLLCLVNGSQILPLLPATDHKRLLDGDVGPNTGGVGAYSPTPNVSKERIGRINTEILQPTLEGLKEDKIHFKGILYVGLMLTEEGAKVLEFNVRFGDPETQCLLPLLETDLANALLDCALGNKISPLRWKEGASCTVVLTSQGYPAKSIVGQPIFGLEKLNGFKDVIAYHGATKQEGDTLITTGGRVLSITATGKNLEQASQRAYAAVEQIQFSGMGYRKDIGRPHSLQLS
jgi:phosphoribosylamine--glycine ligase